MPSNHLSAFAAGGGAMGARVRTFDWTSTPLGPIEQWTPALRIAVDQMLASKFPACLFWGPDLVAIYNDGYRPILGNKADALGQPLRVTWQEVWHQLEPIAQKALNGESTFIEDYLVKIDRNGRTEDAYFTFNYGPVFDERGLVVGMLDTVIETTGRVTLNRMDRAARERHQRLLQQMPGFVAVLMGPQHVFEYVNDAYVSIAGQRHYIGRTIREVFPDLEGQGFFELLDDVYATGRPMRANDRALWLAGVPECLFIDFLYEPIRDEANRVQGIFVGGYDVTMRVRAQADLLASQDRLRALAEQEAAQRTIERNVLATIVETTDTFVQVLDPDLHFLAINRANADEYKRIFGKRPAVGDSLVELLADQPEQQAGYLALWRRAMAGESFTVQEEFGNPKLERRTYEARFEVLRDANGEQTGAFLISTDVTDRLRDLRVLAETQDALRQSQKMEAVGQLTGGIAHDFNNLLAAISGSLQVMQLRLKQGRHEGIERYTEMAERSVRRAAALTQRLLAFSRRQTLDPKPLDVERLLAGMDDLIARSVGPTVQIGIDIPTDLWPIRADASQLENALLNLCINAGDAMPDGGRLNLQCSNARLDAQAARSRELPSGEYVRIAISDSGTGMPPGVIDRIFDPFFTTKPLGQGTGLGLSMVYGFVRQSGGQIEVDSSPGRGTTMSLYLPRHIGDVVADEPVPRPSGDAAADGDTVLLVEDEATVREVLCEVLSDRGYTVLSAEDSAAGLRMLQSDLRIDLLVSDVGLPGGMNGRQLADAGRAVRPGLRVLFITGYAENVAVGNGLMDEGMEIITKPFELEALVGRVNQMLLRSPAA